MVKNEGIAQHLKSIYNLYVYFWRWALWKIARVPEMAGVVSMITASSYLRGPGFSGMRGEMRSSFDSLNVFDLEGDKKGARKTENVFDILIPVCICSGVRRSAPDVRIRTPVVAYRRVTGSRAEKLATCLATDRFSRSSWSQVEGTLGTPLLSGGEAEYDEFPKLTHLFPWQHSGAQFKRKWVIAESRETLLSRWELFTTAPVKERASLFYETRDRKISGSYEGLFDALQVDVPLDRTKATSPEPIIMRYGYRSLDRQWCIADSRCGDFLRPVLWRIASPTQLYFSSLLTKVLGSGPAMIATADVPDMDYFCNRGGKDIIPMWRDFAGREPNISSGFASVLRRRVSSSISSEDIFAYVYAALANPSYVARYAESLQVPGPRVPVTADGAVFSRGAELGRKLIMIHTFGSRFRTAGDGFNLAGKATVRRAVSSYPETYFYEPKNDVLRIADGEIAFLPVEVWDFSVSGLQVVKSWLDYRMKNQSGKKSSLLDDKRPSVWTTAVTGELLELLWVIEMSIALQPALDAFLDDVLSTAMVTAKEVPPPSEAETKKPDVARIGLPAQADLLGEGSR